MLSAYADEHVKAAIVEGLRRRGMDIVTAQERDQRQVEDERLLESSTAESRILLTNDVDFLRIDSRWRNSKRHHAGIVYWRQDLAIGVAVRRIVQYALGTDPEDAADTAHFL